MADIYTYSWPMKNPRRYLFSYFLPVLCVLPVSAFGGQWDGREEASPDDPSIHVSTTVFAEGEELVYEVRWLFVKLGEIRLKTVRARNDRAGGRNVVTALIDSYDLPFADVHSVVHSEIDSTLTCVYSTSTEKRNKGWWLLKNRYDHQTKRLTIEDTWSKEKDGPAFTSPKTDTFTVDGTLQDGLSILYFARSYAHSRGTMNVPTIAYKQLGSTWLRFTSERGTMEIDALDSPIKMVGFEGRADFEGIFGLSGDFEAWFTDDEAAVPIKAKLGVILGSITIELKEWHRSGWTIPVEGGS